jgi:hypothetical protein
MTCSVSGFLLGWFYLLVILALYKKVIHNNIKLMFGFHKENGKSFILHHQLYIFFINPVISLNFRRIDQMVYIILRHLIITWG